MKVFTVVLIALLLVLGCASEMRYDFKNYTYNNVQKQVVGYGFSKSMNEELAIGMAETTARKNIAEQISGMTFVYTNIGSTEEMKLSINEATLSGVKNEKTIRLEKTGVLISIVKAHTEVKIPIGEGVLHGEMRTQFSDDLLKISKSRSNYLQDTISSQFPQAHEIKGSVLINDVDVGWNVDTGVIQYYESYLIVISSVL